MLTGGSIDGIIPGFRIAVPGGIITLPAGPPLPVIGRKSIPATRWGVKLVDGLHRLHRWNYYSWFSIFSF